MSEVSRQCCVRRALRIRARCGTADRRRHSSGRRSATPKWRAHDVLAHLVGVSRTTSCTAGSKASPPTRGRRRRSTGARPCRSTDLLAEWDEYGPQFEDLLAAAPAEIAGQALFDAATHEHDLRNALSARRPRQRRDRGGGGMDRRRAHAAARPRLLRDRAATSRSRGPVTSSHDRKRPASSSSGRSAAAALRPRSRTTGGDCDPDREAVARLSDLLTERRSARRITLSAFPRHRSQFVIKVAGVPAEVLFWPSKQLLVISLLFVALLTSLQA